MIKKMVLENTIGMTGEDIKEIFKIINSMGLENIINLITLLNKGNGKMD